MQWQRWENFPEDEVVIEAIWLNIGDQKGANWRAIQRTKRWRSESGSAPNGFKYGLALVQVACLGEWGCSRSVLLF